MTPEDVEALVATGESETLEFKKSTGSKGPAIKTVCAFLNHRGGHVLFGVRRDGVVIGQHVSDRTIEEISEEIRYTSIRRCRQRWSALVWVMIVR